MHVFLREEPVRLDMRRVDADGVAPPDGMVPVAFYADGNGHPSFRAILPEDTLSVLETAIREPVQLGVLAEEPEGGEIRAMVGISVPVEGEVELEEEPVEPWRDGAPDPDAWKGEDYLEEEEPLGRTALLAFAPLVRLSRRFPGDFGEELADLLESALSGATRPSLQARVEQLLEDL